MLYCLWVINMLNNLITAERLKQCRIRTNQTLEQIGTLVGVHKTTVMRWEKGETERIGLPTIQILASYYGVNPAWLMGADVPMKKADVKKHPVTNDEEEIAKVALFGGSEEVTDEMWNEVKNYVEFIKQRNKKND